MTYSLNEIQALTKRAARGGGYAWGHAEEAGWAVRWLASHGQEGAAAMAALLHHIDGSDPRAFAPREPGRIWQSPSGTLCPIAAGTMLSDFADSWLADGAVEAVSVCAPVLMLPFAAATAKAKGVRLGVRGADWCLSVDGETLFAAGTGVQMAGDQPQTVHVEVAPIPPGATPFARQSRASVPEATIAVLTDFASRILAPATEESRRLGAGTGSDS